MVTLWTTRVKLKMCELSDVSPWYYNQVLDNLVAMGIYDKEGNRLN